jgi:hypothetical protein
MKLSADFEPRLWLLKQNIQTSASGILWFWCKISLMSIIRAGLILLVLTPFGAGLYADGKVDEFKKELSYRKKAAKQLCAKKDMPPEEAHECQRAQNRVQTIEDNIAAESALQKGKISLEYIAAYDCSTVDKKVLKTCLKHQSEVKRKCLGALRFPASLEFCKDEPESFTRTVLYHVSGYSWNELK